MRTIRALFGMLVGIAVLGAIASAATAAVMRRRLASTGDEADDEFDLVTIFDSVVFRSRATALRRGSTLTWYGGGTIDLRGATLASSGTDLSVRAIFGGLRLVVPPAWRVENQLTGIFGGSADARDQAATETDGPTLRITGWAVFGGVGIVDSAPDLDLAAGEPEATAAAPA